MSLILNDFTVNAGRRRLLRIDALPLPSTGLIVVIGPNGAGKSTPLRTLAGVVAHGGKRSLGRAWPGPYRFRATGFRRCHGDERGRLRIAWTARASGLACYREGPREVSRALAALILAALHDLNFAARYADRIVFLENGDLAIAGPTANVFRVPCLNRAYHIDSELLKDRTGGAVIVAYHAVSN
tara:strand:+ start:75434 stop:75985 length:552 start_codon:yes stop_codon:yes gene_type:complete